MAPWDYLIIPLSRDIFRITPKDFFLQKHFSVGKCPLKYFRLPIDNLYIIYHNIFVVILTTIAITTANDL